MPTDETVEAVVEKIIPEGKHGAYAVARSQTLGPITFSLDSNVWGEESWPELGTIVVLTNITKRPAGWRARMGRTFVPSDITSNKQQEPRKK